MLPKTPFTQFYLPRIRKTRELLEKRIWTEKPIEDVHIAWSGSDYPGCAYADISQLKFTPVESFPFTWGPKFHQAWFTIEFDRSALTEFPYFRWNDQAESTLYVDGVPYAGYDPAHLYWKLPEKFTTLHVEGLCLSTGVWLDDSPITGIEDDGSSLHPPTVAKRDEDTWSAWIDLQLIEELLTVALREQTPFDENAAMGGHRNHPLITRFPAYLRKLARATDDALDSFERGDLSAFGRALKSALADIPAAPTEIDAILTGHSHLDLVWLWPESAGEQKAVHTFSSMMRLLEQYPEYVFGYSQPASYRAVERRSPELMQGVRQFIAEGRWEATGVTEVESDTNLACGEAFLRSVLIGQKGFKDLRGEQSKVLWLPDVFGYAGYVPQVLKENGADYFFTTKQVWNNYTRFPYSSFRWRGIDGSEVISHVVQSQFGDGYNGSAKITSLREQAESHDQATVHDEMLSPTGYGDGAGGPTEHILERVRRLQNLAGVPRCRWGRIEDFYDRLGALSDRLPIWSGEIYFEYHRGVQTTHGRLKAAFRGLERALQVAESAAVVKEQGPIDQKWWKRMIFAQFHDYIPGSSIMEVYEEGVPELEALASKAEETVRTLLGSSGNGVFNPHGQATRLVKSEAGKLLQLTIPPFSSVDWSAAVELPAASSAVVSKNELRSARVCAQFDDGGEITSLVIDDKTVRLRAGAGALWLFPDTPIRYEAWDIDRYTMSNGERVTGAAEIEVLTEEPAGATLAFSRPVGRQSTIRTLYELRADESHLRIRYEIDWKEPESLLKVAFPTDYQGHMARFGAGFGSVRREQLSGSLAADGKFEVPASRWAVVADDSEDDGLWIATKDKYGFGARDGLLHLSLVKSALITHTDQNRGIRNLEYTSDFSDLHHHSVEIAIGAFSTQARTEELPASKADTLFTSCVEGVDQGVQGPLQSLSGLNSVVPAWLKTAEDGQGCILRLHETLGRSGQVQLDLNDEWEALRVDMSEHLLADDTVQTICVSPYQIVSLRLRRRVH